MKFVLNKWFGRYRPICETYWHGEDPRTKSVIMTGLEYEAKEDKIRKLKEENMKLESNTRHSDERNREALQRLECRLKKEKDEAVKDVTRKDQNIINEKQAVIRSQTAEIADLREEVKYLAAKQEKQDIFIRRMSMDSSSTDNSGYTITGMMQVIENTQGSWSCDSDKKIVWKITFSTPYAITTPISLLEETIYDELETVLADMGVERTELLDPGECTEDDHVAYRCMFRGNIRTGFWDAEIWVTSELMIIPDYLPAKRKT